MRQPAATFACLISVVGSLGCSSSGADGALEAGGASGSAATGHAGDSTSAAGSSGGGDVGGVTSGGTNAGGAGGASMAGAFGATASVSKGWLYTSGNKIYRSNGSAPGTQWMGRGVNVDDLFFCGYNYMLETQNAEALFKTVVEGLASAWKPSFVRVSLGMNSYPVKTSWLGNDAKYKTPMINTINAIGAHPNTYVLVTLRSDASMTGYDPGNMEATGIPSDATTTPDKAKFPMGTDPVYVALVDTFAQNNFVLFGLANEPGGGRVGSDELWAAMSHAVTTIRAEEDRLHVPHHLVSVQGTGYSSNLGFYVQKPLTQDNVVYEVHGYPPGASSYTYGTLPVIIGEYGSLAAGSEPAFFQDLESKQIPNLAWDFEPYSECAPDLLDITRDATKLTPNAWGLLVQAYLTTHAQP